MSCNIKLAAPSPVACALGTLRLAIVRPPFSDPCLGVFVCERQKQCLLLVSTCAQLGPQKEETEKRREPWGSEATGTPTRRTYCARAYRSTVLAPGSASAMIPSSRSSSAFAWLARKSSYARVYGSATAAVATGASGSVVRHLFCLRQPTVAMSGSVAR